MQSEENATSEFPFGGAGRDHSLAQPVAQLDTTSDRTPSGIGSRSRGVGAFILIALAGGVASGLIPIPGLDLVGPSQPGPKVIETAALAPAPMRTQIEPTLQGIAGQTREEPVPAPQAIARRTQAEPVTIPQGTAGTISQGNAGFFQSIPPSEMETAIAGMMVPEPQKMRLRQELADATTRLVWIALSDSVVEDGDRVTVESVGYSQEVRLFHRPTFVAVPVKPGIPVTIVGTVDGDNQGITVAVHVRGAVLPLAPLAVGTMVQVPSP